MMAIKNYRTLSAEDFMSKLAPHTGLMPDQIIADMKVFIDEGRDYIMIFRDVEFKVLLADCIAYVERTKGEFEELGIFEAGKDDIIPPEIVETKKRPPATDAEIAAKFPKQPEPPAKPPVSKAKREIPAEFMSRAKDNLGSAFDKKPGE